MTSVRMRTPDLPTPAVQWTRVGGRAGCTADSTMDLEQIGRDDLGDPEHRQGEEMKEEEERRKGEEKRRRGGEEEKEVGVEEEEKEAVKEVEVEEEEKEELKEEK